jgi:hypothetical protein
MTIEMRRYFSIVPTTNKTIQSVSILVFLTAIASPIILVFTDGIERFTAILPFAVAILFAYIGYASKHGKVYLSQAEIGISGDLYKKKISLASLIRDRIELINLDRVSQYQPKWRTNGTALPGYLSGWFKLNNGEKAFLLVTARDKVIYLPTTKNYSILMSIENSEEFLRDLAETSL